MTEIGSFIEPRDPSIIGIRMLADKSLYVKKLFTCTEDTETDGYKEDTIKVFLRIKPVTHDELINQQSTLEVINDHTLVAKVPPQTHLSKNTKTESRKYTFSHIFGPTVQQAEVFGMCVERCTRSFLDGCSCLLFTYGTTNSGKTFTVQGTAGQPGIIPRALAMVFKSIAGQESNDDSICPDKAVAVVKLDEELVTRHAKMKSRILAWNATDQLESTHAQSTLYVTASNKTYASSSDDLANEVSFGDMADRLDQEVPAHNMKQYGDVVFSVWVSFTEIYNEAIYDLLQPIQSVHIKREPLKLAQDKDLNCYVKGLSQVRVSSAAEAYKILLFGKRNLRIASTVLNTTSSRSHCIFSIKLITFVKGDVLEPVNISSFSICDLAGAERQKKVLNIGDRLKETQNINASLHFLSRCFTLIRENQGRSQDKQQKPPYRDSKLTQLFQRGLSGKETVTMIVNVNSSSDLFEETKQVLNTSAIALQIVTQPQVLRPRSTYAEAPTKHQRRALSIAWDPEARNEFGLKEVKKKSISSMESRESSVASSHYENERDELLELVEELKKELKTVQDSLRAEQKAKSQLEWKLRNELTSEFLKIASESDAKHLKDLEQTAKEKDAAWQKKMDRWETYYKRQMEKMRDKVEECNLKNESLCNMCNENEDLVETLRVYKCQVEELMDRVNELMVQEATYKEQIVQLTGQCNTLHTSAEELGKQLDTLQIENGTLANKIASKDQKLNSISVEIGQLEQSLKSQIKENEQLKVELEFKKKEALSQQHIHDLELSRLKAHESNRNQELEQVRSNLDEQVAKVVKTFRDEMDRKNLELSELREQNHCQEDIISNLEEERKAFLANQKIIVQRYDDTLIKKQEECEREKREVNCLREALFKSTPTPKKDVDALVEKLKEELALKVNEVEQINKKHEMLRMELMATKLIQNDSQYPQETDENAEPSSLQCRTEPKSRNRPVRKVRTTRKLCSRILRSQRQEGAMLQNNQNLMPPYADQDCVLANSELLTSSDNNLSVINGKQGRKLFCQTKDCDDDDYEQVEVTHNTTQVSPTSYITKILRNRPL